MLVRVPTATVDLSALTAPPAAKDVTFLWMPGERGRVYLANVFIGVVGGFAIWFSIVGSIRVALKGQPNTAIGYLVLGLIAAVTITVMVVRVVIRRRRYGVPSVVLGPRLPAFAAANGWGYDREVVPPRVAILERTPLYNVISSQSRDRIRSDDGGEAAPGAFELGDFIWTVDHGGGKKGIGTYALGYLAVRLPRELPLIVLQSAVPGAAEFLAHPDQVFSLEGDWDRHFTLYCPAGYERDALQVMTPDVMAAMVDDASAWSAQTLGGWLVFVSMQTFARARPEAYARALGLVEVAREFREQAENYSDSRIGDRARDVIAPQGRTLRGRRNPIFAIALLVPLAMILAFIAVPFITGGT
jgi:hypothetical protein